MPVNMDPAKKRRRQAATPEADASQPETGGTIPKQSVQFGEETEEDRAKALADAESKNLWEETEVIDMDKF
jgi:hypothetical protein